MKERKKRTPPALPAHTPPSLAAEVDRLTEELVALAKAEAPPVEPTELRADPVPVPMTTPEALPQPSPLDLVLADPVAALAVYRAVLDGRVKIATWHRAGGRLEARTPVGAVLAAVFPLDPPRIRYGGSVEGAPLPDGDHAAVKASAEARLRALGYTVLA